MAAAAREMRDLLYEKMIAGNDVVQSDVRCMFKEVRILVLRVPGSGKSTLIRLMIGDTGPVDPAQAQQQLGDTMMRHPDPDLPLTIYESNGVDASGNNRVADIKEFLDQQQERVHAVWYVFSATHDCVLHDGGLFKMLESQGEKLRLLLVMTHDDAERNKRKKDAFVEEILGSFSDRERRDRESFQASTIIRVGNDIDVYESTGEIVCEFEVDEEGLGVLSKRTEALMDKEQRTTWAACQAVDVDAKIEESGKLILEKMNHKPTAEDVDQVEIYDEPLFEKQGEMAAIFGSITRGLAKIWNAPENAEKAIISGQFLDQDYWWREVERNLKSHTTTALAWLVGAGASVMGMSNNYVRSRDGQNPLLEWAWNRSSDNTISIPKLVLCFGLHVMATLYYIRIRITINDLAAQVRGSVDECLLLCKTYSVSKWAISVSEFSTHYAADSSERDARGFLDLSSVVDLFGPDSLRLQDLDVLRPTDVEHGRRQTLRVLVVGDERENVEAFLRAATNTDSHDHIVTRTVSASGPCVCSRNLDVKGKSVVAADLRPLPKEDGKSGKLDVLVQQPLQDLTFTDDDVKGKTSSDARSTPLESYDMGKEEVLQIAGRPEISFGI